MFKSKRGIEKNYKIAGAGTNPVDFIRADKVRNFKILFNFIKSKVGNYDKAVEYIGLSNCVMDGMNKGKLSTVQAKKIMDCYNKIKAKE